MEDITKDDSGLIEKILDKGFLKVFSFNICPHIKWFYVSRKKEQTIEAKRKAFFPMLVGKQPSSF